MNAQTRLEHIKANGYNIDFSETFNDAFEIYKKIAVNAGLVFILLAIVAVALIFGIVGAAFGFAAISDNLAGLQMQDFSILHQILYVIIMAVLAGVFAPFTAGIIKMAFQADAGQPFSIGTAFDYYSTSYFGDLFLTGFILAMFSVGVGTLLDVMAIPVLGAFISMVISFLTILAIPLIIFGELKAVDAITGSISVVLKSPLIIIGLLIVGIIVTLVGLIAFCIGYFFTAPFMYALYYSIYKKSVGINTVSEIDEISGIETDRE